MDLSGAVTPTFISHTEGVGSDSFMLSVSMDDEDEQGLQSSEIGKAVSDVSESLPNIEGVPYLLDTDCLLTETSTLSQQGEDVYPSLAISLHSYSQALPIKASECLHNYSQPTSLPTVGANTEVLHNYSQPWPQSTDSYTSVHNYCIANDTLDPLRDVQPQNEVKIFKLSKPDTATEGQGEQVTLKLHLVNSFVCKWRNCDMTFTSIQLLAKHVSTHIKGLAVGFYRCLWKDCKRNELQFEDRYKLVQHMRMHTAEKPHKCSLCLAEFTTAEGLTKHQRIHTGEKPYACPHPGCTKAFRNSGDRYKHTQTHKTSHPYRCKYPGCEKMYTDPGTLRKHAKLKHPDMARSLTGPTVQKKIKAATLQTNSGEETTLNIDEFTVSTFNGSIYCEEDLFMAGVKIGTGEGEATPSNVSNQRIRMLLNQHNSVTDDHASLDLSNQRSSVPGDHASLDLTNQVDSEDAQIINPANWVTFGSLESS